MSDRDLKYGIGIRNSIPLGRKTGRREGIEGREGQERKRRLEQRNLERANLTAFFSTSITYQKQVGNELPNTTSQARETLTPGRQ